MRINMPPKKKKNKGRPPRYVLDEDGKEVVGLSYNPTNRMYYATGTSPRHYFKIGNVKKEVTYHGRYYIEFDSVKLKEAERKKEAIRLFYEWKKSQGKDSIDTDILKNQDEVYVRARRMIEEGVFEDLIEERARELIAVDKNIQKDIYERACKIIDAITGKCKYDSYPVPRDLENQIDSYLNSLTRTRSKHDIEIGCYDKEIYERAKQLLEKKPHRAAKELKMPFITKLSTYKKYFESLSFTLRGFWSLFCLHKDPNQYLYDINIYLVVFEKLGMILGELDFNKVSFEMFEDAFDRTPDLIDYFKEKYEDSGSYTEFNGKRYSPRQLHGLISRMFVVDSPKYNIYKDIRDELNELTQKYAEIPPLDRLEILEDVFTTLQTAGFPQATPVLQYIKELSKKY